LPGLLPAATPSGDEGQTGDSTLKVKRLDERVVEEGLAESRSSARALILSGRVLVDDVPVDKAGGRVSDDAQIRLKGGDRRYVSRGGDKLEGALADLGIDPRGRRCLDIGASTGGFSDCLLQHGAADVVALDVGRGQLHERLRQDARVSVIEKTNARHMTAATLPWSVDLVVIDVSFISLRWVLPAVAESAPDAEVVALVKPQFEVGRDRVGKGGVVRDESHRAEAVADVARTAEAADYRVSGRVDSRLPGPKGNREVFLWLIPARRAPAG
jgi:23S rRNA (cytidine1920-2'-O)/16S rRNA (cytidine1409-2'-O)-methyltransferase